MTIIKKMSLRKYMNIYIYQYRWYPESRRQTNQQIRNALWQRVVVPA